MQYSLIQPVDTNLSIRDQICFNRGLEPTLLSRFLNPSGKEVLSPFLLRNMKEGIACLMHHVHNCSKTLFIVDSDADGNCSAAILTNYLYNLFPTFVNTCVDFHFHQGKEHGLVFAEHGDELADYGLIVITDAGSNQYEVHKKLKEMGIDVLIIDHHLANKESEDAIVINNQLSPEYPNKQMSGGGVVYQFCRAIDSLLKKNVAETLVDLVSLSLIGDMMDLKSLETKYLISKGIDNPVNPFIIGLLEKQAYPLGNEITPIGLAFYIVPLINATIRVGTQEEKEIMFQALLAHKAYTKIPSTKRGCKGQSEFIIQQAVRNCTNIRNRQVKLRDEGTQLVEDIIVENNLNDNKVLAVLLEDGKGLDSRITGLIANQLMSKYQKPILLGRRGEKDGKIYYSGSARGYEKSKLKNFKDFLAASELFEYTEGHQSAFGFCIAADRVDQFIEYANEELKDYDFSTDYKVDLILNANECYCEKTLGDIIFEIGEMKSLWGKGFDESLIAIEGLRLVPQDPRLYLMSPDRSPTIKISHPSQRVDFIKFKSSLEEHEELQRCFGNQMIELNIVGTASINEYNGTKSAQVFIKEYQVANSEQYYF